MAIRDELPVVDRGSIEAAVTEVSSSRVFEVPTMATSPLVGKWINQIRQYHQVGDTAAMPGARVVAIVCAHKCVVFLEHRKTLEEFLHLFIFILK